MNPEMNLLYLKSSGHVLAAFTRSGEPDTGEKLADAFVGDGLHVRGLGVVNHYASTADFNLQDFVIPKTDIGVFRTALDNSVLRSPRDSYLTSLDASPALNTMVNPSLVLAPAPAPATLPYTSTFTVVLSPPSDKDFPVLVYFVPQSPGQIISKPMVLGKSTPSLTLPTPDVGSGSYYALIFVATYPLEVVPFKV
jgi:hypothetical protein